MASKFKTLYLVYVGKEVVPLSVWCERNKVKYNTIFTRIWRSDIATEEEDGVVKLYPNKPIHAEIMSIKPQKTGRKYSCVAKRN